MERFLDFSGSDTGTKGIMRAGTGSKCGAVPVVVVNDEPLQVPERCPTCARSGTFALPYLLFPAPKILLRHG